MKKIFEELVDGIALILKVAFRTLYPIVTFLVLEYTYRRDYNVPDIFGTKHFPSLPFDKMSFSIAQILGLGEVRWFSYYLFLFTAVLLDYLLERMARPIK
jgi:hypothetical protein